jgi:hypothetical protein
MTRVDGKSAGVIDHVIHVGVICGRRMLTSAQRGGLGNQLRLIGEEHRGHVLILHHGCGRDGDEVAHQAVRALGGWRIHGHPASERADGEVLLRAGVMRGLSRIHESKPSRERDADIVDASEILIVITGGRPQPELDASVKRAEASSRTVIYLKGTANANKPPTRKPDSPPKRLSAAAGGKDVAWAVRQGRQDKIAGKRSQGYKRFRSSHDLQVSDTSLHLWHTYRNAYQKQPQRAQVSPPASKLKQKSRWTSGLTLDDAAVTGRNAARRYDRAEPRKSDLSPENAALLKKLNQPETLVDSWR